MNWFPDSKSSASQFPLWLRNLLAYGVIYQNKFVWFQCVNCNAILYFSFCQVFNLVNLINLRTFVKKSKLFFLSGNWTFWYNNYPALHDHKKASFKQTDFYEIFYVIYIFFQTLLVLGKYTCFYLDCYHLICFCSLLFYLLVSTFLFKTCCYLFWL